MRSPSCRRTRLRRERRFGRGARMATVPPRKTRLDRRDAVAAVAAAEAERAVQTFARTMPTRMIATRRAAVAASSRNLANADVRTADGPRNAEHRRASGHATIAIVIASREANASENRPEIEHRDPNATATASRGQSVVVSPGPSVTATASRE